MELLIIRHAIAEPHAMEIDDVDRALTSRGRERFAQGVAGLTRLGLRIGDVYHSPWLRAVQTAEMLSPLVDGQLISTPHLADDPGAGLLAHARESGGLGRVAMVGHEPWLGQLCAWLVTGSTRAGEALLFKKGGVAWLEGGSLQPGTMVLRALFPPRALRLLAESPTG